MPTVLTHPAPLLAVGAGLGFVAIPPRLLLFGVLCSLAPDADVIGFQFGVRYADILGHRGLTHSLSFAFALGILGFVLAPWLRTRRWLAFLVGFAAVLSHIALDALTTGGLGVAALWPFSEQRFFFPERPIRVSPFNPRAFLEPRGQAVLRSELFWVWLPCAAMAVGLRIGLLAGRAQTKDLHTHKPTKT